MLVCVQEGAARIRQSIDHGECLAVSVSESGLHQTHFRHEFDFVDQMRATDFQEAMWLFVGGGEKRVC